LTRIISQQFYKRRAKEINLEVLRHSYNYVCCYLVNTSARAEKLSIIILYEVKATNIKTGGIEAVHDNYILQCPMLQHVFGCNTSNFFCGVAT
jgi:hypothetical protein